MVVYSSEVDHEQHIALVREILTRREAGCRQEQRNAARSRVTRIASPADVPSPQPVATAAKLFAQSLK